MSFDRLRKSILMATIGAALIGIPSAWAAPLNIPTTGMKMEDTTKQSYMSDVMQTIFNPTVQANSAKTDFVVPDGWNNERYAVGNAFVEHMQSAEHKTNRVILQLHGGGYVAGLTDGHRTLALKIATLTNASDVYTVDYRLAPEHVYPAALDDAVAAYQDILAKGVKPSDIFVIGDSAGGNLAIELSLYLKAHNMSQPAALALASPWTTFETKKNSSRTTNNDKEQVLGKGTPLSQPVVDAAYKGSLKLNDPRVSPNYADMSGLPPMLVQTGGNEVFLTENQEFVNKAISDGVEVTFTTYPGMPHDFALLFPYMQESIDSITEIKDFANRTMTDTSLRTLTEKPTVGLYEFTVPNEQIAVFNEQGIRNFTSSMAQEANTLTMNVGHVKDNPNKAFVLEAYTNDAALAEHRNSAHFKEYIAEIGSKLSDRKVYQLEPQALLEQPGAKLMIDDKEALVNLVKVTVKPGYEQAFKDVVMPEMQESINDDPNVLVMYALTDKETPNEWYFYEIYANEAAYQNHRAKPYFQEYLAKTAGMLESDKVFYSLSLDVAARHGGLRYVNQ